MEKVLVLNSDYTPLNVTNVLRGFNLVNRGKAEILKSSDTPLFSGIKKFIRPLIIRLLNYVKFRPKSIRITRQRIFTRDGHTCTYCGSKKNLTIDHIIPKSRGGKNTWTNMVTCCSGCNRYKGDKTPEEVGYSLNIKPFEPSIFSSVVNQSIESIWSDYQQKLNFGVY